MAEFLQLPDEPTTDERDKLFSLASTAMPGPHDEEFYYVARAVVPKLQRQILRLEKEAEMSRLAQPTGTESKKVRK